MSIETIELDVTNGFILKVNPISQISKIDPKELTCFFDALGYLKPKNSDSEIKEVTAIRKKYTEKLKQNKEDFSKISFVLEKFCETLEKILKGHIPAKPEFTKKLKEKYECNDQIIIDFIADRVKFQIEHGSLPDIQNLLTQVEQYVFIAMNTMQNSGADLSQKKPLATWLEKINTCSDDPRFSSSLTGTTTWSYMFKELIESSEKGQDKLVRADSKKTLSSVFENLSVSYALTKEEIAKKYGFEKDKMFFSDKKTTNPERVIDYLKSHGPLVVCGNFSPSEYKEPASSRKIGEKEVYAFKKGSFSEKGADEEHAIIIVGSTLKGYGKTTQDLLYYIDPAETDKVFVISYENFLQRVSMPVFYHPDLAKELQKKIGQSNRAPSLFFTSPPKTSHSSASSIQETSTLSIQSSSSSSDITSHIEKSNSESQNHELGPEPIFCCIL